MTDTINLDHDRHMKARISKWLKDRQDAGGDFNDTPTLLLDFYNFLQECEAERQRA